MKLKSDNKIYTREDWKHSFTEDIPEMSEVTEDIFYEMYEVLPPITYPKGFQVSEPIELGTYMSFATVDGRYFYLGVFPADSSIFAEKVGQVLAKFFPDEGEKGSHSDRNMKSAQEEVIIDISHTAWVDSMVDGYLESPERFEEDFGYPLPTRDSSDLASLVASSKQLITDYQYFVDGRLEYLKKYIKDLKWRACEIDMGGFTELYTTDDDSTAFSWDEVEPALMDSNLLRVSREEDTLYFAGHWGNAMQRHVAVYVYKFDLIPETVTFLEDLLSDEEQLISLLDEYDTLGELQDLFIERRTNSSDWAEGELYNTCDIDLYYSLSSAADKKDLEDFKEGLNKWLKSLKKASKSSTLGEVVQFDTNSFSDVLRKQKEFAEGKKQEDQKGASDEWAVQETYYYDDNSHFHITRFQNPKLDNAGKEWKVTMKYPPKIS